MLTYGNVFEHELKKLIMAQVDRLLDGMSRGAAIGDYADYKQQLGKIAGLRTALELFEEAREKADQAR